MSEDDIDRVVAKFYALVRADAGLGPVFAAHVTDWSGHEAKIGRFWRNALLLQRCYDGNPMQVHKAAQNVHAAHFPVWLALFDEVLDAELPAPVAKSWSALAHRIGQGLSYGLPSAKGSDDVPMLG